MIFVLFTIHKCATQLEKFTHISIMCTHDINSMFDNNNFGAREVNHDLIKTLKLRWTRKENKHRNK